MKLITVFNSCGISGKENAGEYVGRIHNLLNQREVEQRVVWSSCRNAPRDWDRLFAEFGDKISYCLTEELITINQSFNLACRLAARECGMPDGFLYIDSGIHFQADGLAVQKLCRAHESGPWAMTAGMVDVDAGLQWWFPGMSEDQIFDGDRLEMPVGKATNLHVQIFDKRLVEAFGRPLPDIFASHSTESTFTFLCAALGLKFGLWRNVRAQHDMSMDGASAGFNEGMGWAHLLPCAPKSMAQIIADPEARACGFGYEECKQVLMHDGTLYDAAGRVADPQRLGTFIKENLYLPPQRFDYERVECVFIP